MYAGMDAWILTQLFDSLLMTSEIGMKSDMKSVVRSVARAYNVTLPVPLNHFRVSTDVPDEIAMAEANKETNKKNTKNGMSDKNMKKEEHSKEEDENHKKIENIPIHNDDSDSNDIVIMQKSLPLKAMVFKELNMSKKWNVPSMYGQTEK